MSSPATSADGAFLNGLYSDVGTRLPTAETDSQVPVADMATASTVASSAILSGATKAAPNLKKADRSAMVLPTARQRWS